MAHGPLPPSSWSWPLTGDGVFQNSIPPSGPDLDVPRRPVDSVFVSVRSQAGRVTLPALTIAVVAGVLVYAATKYLPVRRDFGQVKALVAEAGQRAAKEGTAEGGRAWFDRRAAEEGIAWLRADSLIFEQRSPGSFDVGVRYEVRVQHLLLGTHRFELSYYCTATPETCRRFVPEW